MIEPADDERQERRPGRLGQPGTTGEGGDDEGRPPDGLGVTVWSRPRSSAQAAAARRCWADHDPPRAITVLRSLLPSRRTRSVGCVATTRTLQQPRGTGQ